MRSGLRPNPVSSNFGNIIVSLLKTFSGGIETIRIPLRVALAAALLLAFLAATAGGQVSAQSVCASQSTEPTSPLIRDCETLLDLKDQLDPDGVLDWSGTLPLNQWDGVTSDAIHGVTRLILIDKNLTGSIPSNLSSLTSLTSLHLSENPFEGGIPDQLGNLQQLEYLSLSNIGLTGTIPSSLGNLSNLLDLGLYGNSLSGTIPSSLGSLGKLKDLGLGHNQLEGSIPSQLGSLTELIHLSLHSNQLSGTIPTTLGNLGKLETLRLATNSLTGSVPSQLGNLSRLQVLALLQNQLTGTIPSTLGNLSALTEFKLSENRLNGAIPPQLGSLSNLRFLDLQCNQLTGRIPSSLAGIAALQRLKVHGNMISQDLPTGLVRPGLRITIGPDCNSPIEVGFQPPPPPPPPPPNRSSGTTGGSSGGSSASTAQRSSPHVGSTSAATATELPGDKLRLDIHGQPSNSIQLGIGWVSRDASQVNLVGVIRDQTLGQTYLIVRHEGYPHIVRRWVPPYSPLIYAINWPLVITQFSFPVEVISAIPLDHRHPPPNMLVRRFDGFDVRIFVYDAALQQWRHIPDYGTFQTMGFYWCNVTAADPHFFDRITIGPAIPSSNTPIRSDHPNCSTG